MASFVYKYVLNGDEIIYVGITDFLKKRIEQHGKYGDNIPEEAWDDINSADVFFVQVNDRTTADIIESKMIKKYKPKYNKAKQKKKLDDIDLPELDWRLYCEGNSMYTSMRHLLMDKEFEIESNKIRIDSLNEERELLMNEVVKLRKERGYLTNEVVKLRREREPLTNEIVKLRDEIDVLMKEISYQNQYRLQQAI